MNTRFVVCRARLILAAVLLSGICSTAAAQDSIEFLFPPDGTRRSLNFDQAVTIEWLIGNEPFRGDVTLTTTVGEVLQPIVKTDDFGRATFIVRSSSTGIATLTATGDNDLSSMELEFVVPPPGSDLLLLKPDELPFGDNSVLREDDESRKYWLAKDRVALEPTGDFSMDDIETFINDNGVVDHFYISATLLVLVFDDDMRTMPLRELTRVLAGLTTVRKAGLVAQRDRSGQLHMVPDEVIIRFVDIPTTVAEQDQFRADFDLSAMRQVGLNPRRFVAEVDIAQWRDPILLVTELRRDARVVNADPNYTVVGRPRSASAGEPGFDFQWYHDNDGHYAAYDADIDTDLAWHFTEGNHSVMVAVLDGAFDIHHPDLIENLHPANPENFAVDLWDNDNLSLLGDDTWGFSRYTHGTSAAGIAGARGDNNIGYSGSCSHCQLLFLRLNNYEQLHILDALLEVVNRGASVLSASWGFESETELELAFEEVVNQGVTVVMAMTNEDIDNCSNSYVDLSAMPHIIAVSGITDYDQRSPYAGQAKGHGKCMDVLAPTLGGEKGMHTTAVVLTDAGPVSTYWHDFSGTSAATPLVAGVVGLLKSADATAGGLSPLTIQRILQDTADRVDPANANYSAESGFSNPGGMPTHGYGRINAYEAVKLVASATPGDGIPAGRSGQDLLLRDNPTDWGNTEKPSNYLFDYPRGQYPGYQSVDIKIDADPLVGTPPNTAAGFAALGNDLPISGKGFDVYVRLRNRGPETVAAASVKLHAAVLDGMYPNLPDDFWAQFPSDSLFDTKWQTVEDKLAGDVPYSGASAAGCPGRNVPQCYHPTLVVNDDAVILRFNVGAMDFAADERVVLLAVAYANDDLPRGVVTGSLAYNDVQTAVNYDNNVTMWDPYTPGGGGGSGGDLLLFLMLVAGSRPLRSRSERVS